MRMKVVMYRAEQTRPMRMTVSPLVRNGRVPQRRSLALTPGRDSGSSVMYLSVEVEEWKGVRHSHFRILLVREVCPCTDRSGA